MPLRPWHELTDGYASQQEVGRFSYSPLHLRQPVTCFELWQQKWHCTTSKSLKELSALVFHHLEVWAIPQSLSTTVKKKKTQKGEAFESEVWRDGRRNRKTRNTDHRRRSSRHPHQGVTQVREATFNLHLQQHGPIARSKLATSHPNWILLGPIHRPVNTQLTVFM